MRIDELTGISDTLKFKYKELFSNTENMDIDHFVKKLYNFGFNKIGSGFFSVVYAHPEFNFIIKVINKNFPYRNYEEFVTKYTKNKRFNKYLPRIYKSLNFHDDGKAYILEKLYPLSMQEKQYFDKLRNINYMLKGDFEENLLISEKEYNEFIDKYPELAMTIIDLSKMYLFDDLKGENIMKRKDGQYVIIDPVAG